MSFNISEAREWVSQYKNIWTGERTDKRQILPW